MLIHWYLQKLRGGLAPAGTAAVPRTNLRTTPAG